MYLLNLYLQKNMLQLTYNINTIIIDYLDNILETQFFLSMLFNLIYKINFI